MAEIRDIPPVMPIWPKKAPDQPVGREEERRKRRESTEDKPQGDDQGDDQGVDEYA